MHNRFNTNYRSPNRDIYNPVNNLDKIVSLTIDGPNIQIIEPMNIEISRPYIKHVVHKDQRYFMNSKGVKCANLGEIFKSEAFQEAIIFEFYKEKDSDTDPETRVNELFDSLSEKKHKRKLPLEIFLIRMPCSMAEHHQEESKYLVIRADEESGYNIRQLLVK